MMQTTQPAKVQRGGLEPLSPPRKWRAITLATLLLVPAFWFLMAGLVATAADGNREQTPPNAAAGIALGLALIPFVFIVLAFASAHPRAAGAVAKAMGWSLLVGLPVSALAGDAVTGIVAGVGAGGIVALRMDDEHNWRARALAVAIASAYAFVLVRTAGVITLLSAPIFPFTAIGIADHCSEWRRERDAAAARASS
jgi:hypothetical protein